MKPPKAPWLVKPVWVLDLGIYPSHIWDVLATFADNDTAVCWPSVAAIARRADCSEGTVKQALRTLADAGAITIQKRIAEHGGATSNLITMRPEAPGGVGHHMPQGGVPHDHELRTQGTKKATTSVVAYARQDRDEIFDAIGAVVGWVPGTGDKTGGARFGRCVRALLDQGATPLEVQRRAAAYRTMFDGAILTPEALLKHWSALAVAPPPASAMSASSRRAAAMLAKVGR